MTTIVLREKEYELGYFTELHVLPLARFFIAMKGDSLLTEKTEKELRGLIKSSSFAENEDLIIAKLTDNTVPLSLWKELGETLKDIIIPTIPSSLVNPSIRRGVFLTPDEFLNLYVKCLEQLKETNQLSEKDIEELEEERIDINKDDEIAKLQDKIKTLQS